jgi:nucleotide-binding universal stress UspA family protein
MRSLRQRSTTPSLPCCTCWRRSQVWPRREETIAAATEQLDKLIPPELRKTRKIKTAVRIGKPYREIIQLALEAQTDLVTMGVRGRGALDLAVFGSTTYRVMQLGSCPVLAVHV